MDLPQVNIFWYTGSMSLKSEKTLKAQDVEKLREKLFGLQKEHALTSKIRAIIDEIYRLSEKK